MCPSWEDCLAHVWSTILKQTPDGLVPKGTTGLQKALMEGSKPVLMLSSVILPKHKLGRCLLKNQQGFGL